MNILPTHPASQPPEADGMYDDTEPHAKLRPALQRIAARIPLRWRVAIVAFLLLAGLMGSLGMLISLTEEHVLFANQAVALRNEAQLAVGGPRNSPGGVNDIRDLNRLAGQLAGASTRVTVYAPDGTLFGTTNSLPQVPPAVRVRAALIREAITNPPNSDSYHILADVTGSRELVVLIPLTQDGGVIALSTPTQAIDAAVGTTRVILLIGILGALLIAAAVLLPLMNAALKPLRTMEETTRRIAEGDLSLRVDEPPTDDEVGQLARSFNAMVQRLDAAFARQKRFVADVSHELRTPLTALGGGLEMMMLGVDNGEPERGRRLLRGMYAEVERMRRLVQDLLMLARLDEGRQALRVGRIEVASLLAAVEEEAQQIAKGQEVTLSIQPGLPAIAADADHARQVLLILVDNALKFTPVPGQVDIRAVMEGTDAVRIEVQDTGPGIAPDVLPHIFDRFYRADPSRVRTKGQAGGSGLGLSIAKGLTEAMGGQIGITSTAGKGACAWLRFPRYLSPEVHAPHLPTGAGALTPRLGVPTASE